MPESPITSARSHAQINLSDVAVTFNGAPVLNGVNLVVTPTSRWAIVGENGAGKSTLLHILAGTLTPDSGTVTRVGTRGLAEQEMLTTDARTVGQVVADSIADPLAALVELDAASISLSSHEPKADDRYSAALEKAEAMDAWDAERRVRIALDALGAETHHSRLLTELSVGQRYRVRLACLLGSSDDFLLLDEPTNHLDRTGLDYLTEQVRTRAGGVVVVSHDRAFLTDVTHNVYDLDPTPDGRPRVYGAGYAGYRVGRATVRAQWEQEFERQQAETTRLSNDLHKAQNRLVSGWRPDKGTGKHQRATRAAGLVQSVHRRQEALESQRLPIPTPPQKLRFPDLETRSGSSLLVADAVTVAGRLPVPISLSVSGRSKQLVTGPNGSGKSTLLSVLAGHLTPTSGRTDAAQDARVVLLRQESSLPPHRRVGEFYSARVGEFYSARVGELVVSAAIPTDSPVSLSALGLLRANEMGKRIGELSIGRQRRLDLALALACRPHVLLLDEPTNHLSIALVDELTDALGATDAAVVVSTHDRQMLRDLQAWPRLRLSGAEL